MNSRHREKRQDSDLNAKPADIDAGTGVFEAAEIDTSQAVPGRYRIRWCDFRRHFNPLRIFLCRVRNTIFSVT